MADIFWGVSDALDLYSEYIYVQNNLKPKIEPELEGVPFMDGKKEIGDENSSNEGQVLDEDKKTIDEVDGEGKLDENNDENPSGPYIDYTNMKKRGAGDGPDDVDNIKNDLQANENGIASKENIDLVADDDNSKSSISNDGSVQRLQAGNEDLVKESTNQKSLEEVIIEDEYDVTPSTSKINFNPSTLPSPIKEVDQENENKENSTESKQKVINILIYGGGDIRHIIKTMAKRYTHVQNEDLRTTTPILKFYVVDGCVELIARNLALLGIALERPEHIGLRSKVHLFMDIYGNSLLRPICQQYLISKATTLQRMITDKSILDELAPFINLDTLKYRERDGLQDALEFWHPKPGYDFKIQDYWMGRVRRLLAVRFDSREGVFDWDLNMSLKDRGAQQICSQEYRYWRETGIAFTFPEYEQSKPNKTLSAGLVRNGNRYMHRGYIGDIQTGPFCSFGLRSAEERMLRSAHGENDYRATDVTERNLLEYFHEIQCGTPYEHSKELSNKYGGVRFQMGERLIYDETTDTENINAYDKPWINVEGIEVNFLSVHEAKPIGQGNKKWENFFDVAFVGYKYFQFLEDFFVNILRDNALLILETKLRSVQIKSTITEFETELQNFAQDSKLESVLNYKALNTKNSILKFWKPAKNVRKNF